MEVLKITSKKCSTLLPFEETKRSDPQDELKTANTCI